MPAPRLALVFALGVAAAGFAQIQIDDRPKVLEPGPLTKDELNRRKADELLRDARTLYGVGLFRQRHDKLLEAVKTLEKAAALDPESQEVRRALVPLYVTVGREEEAMALCRQVLDRDPHDAETGYEFAKLLRSDGKPAEAVAVLQRVVGTKAAQERPERLLFMLSDLYDLLEKQEDFAGAARAQDAIIRTITEKREQLLYGNGFTREDLNANLARAYERLGRACVKTKEHARAAAAFRSARDTLLKAEDPEARHQAVRLHWNLSEVAAAQQKWAEALDALDAYLEHSPAEVDPYETKVELLRKLGRDREVVPTLRQYAAREQFHLGLQLLLARELGKDPRTRRDAERIYRGLLEKHVKPEIYRGLFHLYRDEDRMGQVLDLLDDAERVVEAKEGAVKADAREAAQERAAAMLTVLRSDPALVSALLPEALAELGRNRKRTMDTWAVLAALATRARKLEEAERLYRQCLGAPKANGLQEIQVYAGLIRVLQARKNHDDVIRLCRDALRGARQFGQGLNQYLHRWLAEALADKGDYEQALTHSRKAVELSSEGERLNAWRQTALILARAGRYDEAVGECEAAMKEFPQLTRVHSVRYMLSTVYGMKGDHEKSEEQLRLILESDPYAPLANNNLGYQLADRNVNLDEAERLIRRAIDADRAARKELDEDGDNASYLDSLGWVLFRKGKLDEAREWLEKAAALPDGAENAEVWDHLGDVYAKLGRPAKAKEAWQAALKFYKDEQTKRSEARRVEVQKKLDSLK